MKYTPNLNLKKPDLIENVLISDLNENMDVLDGAVSELQKGSTSIPDLETNDKTLAGAINELKQTVNDFQTDAKEYTDQHAADTSHTKWIERVGGKANAITATIDGLTSYKNGLAVSFSPNKNSTSMTTLNINNLGDVPIVKANGFLATNLKSVGVYTVRYLEGAFILQGEGGSGNAQPIDVRKGKTFTNDNGEQTGTLVAYGVSEEVPLDKVIDSSSPFPSILCSMPIKTMYPDLIDNNMVTQKKALHYNHKNQLIHAAGSTQYRTFSLSSNSLIQTLQSSRAVYVHSFDKEGDMLYVSLETGRIRKLSASSHFQWWETPTTGSTLVAKSVTHVPNNQGVVVSDDSSTSTRYIAYNSNGDKKWDIPYYTIPGRMTAMCADRAGDVYVTTQMNSSEDSNMPTYLHKINGVTGAIIKSNVWIWNGYYNIHIMKVDETNRKLVMAYTNGKMEIRSKDNIDTMLVWMPDDSHTTTIRGLEVDKLGYVYVLNSGGGVDFRNGIAQGVLKLTPGLTRMWTGANIPYYGSVIALDLEHGSDNLYPDLFLGFEKYSGKNSQSVRHKQTMTVKS